jgi:hypothetical protein
LPSAKKQHSAKKNNRQSHFFAECLKKHFAKKVFAECREKTLANDTLPSEKKNTQHRRSLTSVLLALGKQLFKITF